MPPIRHRKRVADKTEEERDEYAEHRKEKNKEAQQRKRDHARALRGLADGMSALALRFSCGLITQAEFTEHMADYKFKAVVLDSRTAEFGELSDALNAIQQAPEFEQPEEFEPHQEAPIFSQQYVIPSLSPPVLAPSLPELNLGDLDLLFNKGDSTQMPLYNREVDGFDKVTDFNLL